MRMVRWGEARAQDRHNRPILSVSGFGDVGSYFEIIRTISAGPDFTIFEFHKNL